MSNLKSMPIKIKRTKAYEELVEDSKPYYNFASLLWVKKKIKKLQTVFKKEYNKIEESGAGTNDIYETTLWYYNLLLSTIEQEPIRRSVILMAKLKRVDCRNSIRFFSPQTPSISSCNLLCPKFQTLFLSPLHFPSTLLNVLLLPLHLTVLVKVGHIFATCPFWPEHSRFHTLLVLPLRGMEWVCS